MAAVPTTPTGVKPNQAKKPYSEYVGVDVSAVSVGFADDLAAVAEMRRAPTQPVAATNPKA